MNGRYNVPKARPKDLFQAMLARTTSAYSVPPAGETDPRYGPMEPLPNAGPDNPGYMRRPRPTATATLGVQGEEGAHMAEKRNSPRLKKKRVMKRLGKMEPLKSHGEED
jgi:hypothetical protein